METNFKQKAVRDASHLDFIRGLPCLVCNAPPKSDPHHVNKRMMSSMGRTASDDRAIPLCRKCHREGAHGTEGEEAFYDSIGGREKVEAVMGALFKCTGDREKAMELILGFRNGKK